MSDDLKDDLMDIRGIGEAKADTILEVLKEHETDGEAMEAVEKALDYMDQGDYTYGEKYLRRLVE